MIHLFHKYEILAVDHGRIKSVLFGDEGVGTQIILRCRECGNLKTKIINGRYEKDDLIKP